MSEPRILTPTDRATIRQRWALMHDRGKGADMLALLDTCDAMQAVIRRLRDGWLPVIRPHANQYEWVHEVQRRDAKDGGDYQPVEPMTPAEAAVLDTILEDHIDG